jgi:DNA polymerase III delta prime subunit
MFFQNSSQISEIAKKSGFSIFCFPKNYDLGSLELKSSFTVRPDEKGTITVEAVRDLTNLTKSKQPTDAAFVFYGAEALTESAENALLKLLEQPSDNTHFIFLTKSLTSLLPTIKSRANLYFYKQIDDLANLSSQVDLVPLAKALISASKSDLLSLAEQLAKNREKALSVTESAIEIARKSYFKTKSPALLKKLEKLLNLYDNLSKNGHVKLHIVADMV